nr:xylosyltransferase oxt [Onthophagus taurus]
MVIVRNVYNWWMRNFRWFAGFGIVLFSFQLYFIYNVLNYENSKSWWSPRGDTQDSGSNLYPANSARRVRDDFVDDEDLKSQKNKVTRSNHTLPRLRIEELDFTPSCQIKTKEAISSIHRAKTQQCKQQISNVTCLIQQGIFYPKRLPNFCDPKGHKEASLGCFKDSKSFRILSGYFIGNVSKNSPEYCKYLCLQSGFPYAGVEYGVECFCGAEEPPSSAKLPDSSCNMKCPGDNHSICGGIYKISIYETGIKKFIPQIANVSNSMTNMSVKIVFLLTLNGRALRQVKRLLKTLYHRNHYYYIHVDVRQDYLFRELLPLEETFPNIRLTRNRFATIWGGASLLQMLLSTMKELIDLHTDWNWDFVINLSESDYPVKTVQKLTDFLSANRDRNFVKSHGHVVQRFIQKQGLDRTFVECDYHMWRVGERKLPYGVQIDGGSDWVTLSRRFVSYLTRNEKDKLLEGLIFVFKYTLLPAESFFHTVLRNSQFCDTFIDNNLHVTNWKRRLGCKCQYKHIVDWCGCSPNDIKPEDWTRILNTEFRQVFFARKFEPIISQSSILKLEEWMYKQNFSNVLNINSYWQNLYSHKDQNDLDDALRTVAESIVRLISVKICPILLNNIIEITWFHSNDEYQKTLILFNATLADNKSVTYEVSFKPRQLMKRIKKTNVTKRLKTFHVSTDYDPKEQISRNFHRIFGPYSEPLLIYNFTSDFNTEKDFNITFLWIDPTGKPVDVNYITLDEGVLHSHQKSTLKQPFLPGIWTVMLIHKRNEIARTNFLVTPLNYYQGNEIVDDQTTKLLHSGSGVYKKVDVRWLKYTVTDWEQDRLEQLSIKNSNVIGKELKDWIDSLVNKFYVFGDLCTINESIFCNDVVKRCANTNWSSLAPDPKSELDRFNRTSGMFDLL